MLQEAKAFRNGPFSLIRPDGQHISHPNADTHNDLAKMVGHKDSGESIKKGFARHYVVYEEGKKVVGYDYEKPEMEHHIYKDIQRNHSDAHEVVLNDRFAYRQFISTPGKPSAHHQALAHIRSNLGL